MTIPTSVRRMDLTLGTVVVAIACSCSEAPSSAVRETSPIPPVASEQQTAAAPVDQGLVAAQEWLASKITNDPFLDARFDREPVDLTSPVMIDFNYGSGHGGSLVWVRISVDGHTTRCERVTWQEYRKNAATPAGTASRAEVPTSNLSSLLDAVRALSHVSVSERPRDWESGSSNDFFVLVRVCRAEVSEDRTWEFAGYECSSDAVRYAAPKAVLDKAKSLFEPVPWKPFPASDIRRTHFSDAFNRNCAIYGDEFHGWVMGRSVAALGWFGDRSALPTVAWIRENVHDFAMLRHVLDEPAMYLEGPPREIPEK